ncbi:uncharacterized protein BX663DRAFT_506164, partial [Cokeromyces recurvatus]|uniref:uncharacterized protein n=1 Tax=Cokeromyces recurvatus TaxID=90255 RepID=UPI0022202360
MAFFSHLFLFYFILKKHVCINLQFYFLYFRIPIYLYCLKDQLLLVFLLCIFLYLNVRNYL